MRLAEAAAVVAPTPAEGPEDELVADNEAEEEAPPEMSAARSATVEELFKAWDHDGKGSISILNLQQCTVSNGPQTMNLFKALEAMDTDDDKEVTLTEMIAYFTIVGEKLSDDEFESLRQDMLELAQNRALIASLTAIASNPMAGGPSSEAPAAEEEETEPPAELSKERVALCEELYTTFVSSTETSIPLADLESDCVVEMGPARTNPFAWLRLADANSDGQLTFDEMKAYFAVLGEAMTDDEFSIVLNEMIDSAASKAVLKAAAM